MYKKLRLLIVEVLILSMTSSLYGQTSVSPNPVLITQPDKTTLTIIGRGTPNKPFTETVDGYTLLRNKKGFYVYAQLDINQKLTPSKLKAHDPSNRTLKEIKCLEKKFKLHLR